MWAAPGDSCGLKTLWTDSPEAHRTLDEMFATGMASRTERDDLAHFIDHGWLVWRGAIEPERIDAFANDIRSHHRHPGRFLTTDHRRNAPGLKLSGSVPDRYESLFDLYVNLESARAVCFHPRLVRFLALIFRSRPVALQQLLFQRSNGHRVHQDTSVVAVEDPLLMAASWIALEDVVEGSGELAFYDRSHKLPHYLFKEGTKRLNPQVDSEQDYNRDLEEACRKAGMEYERFLAKKGDVFLWAADLVHRSHPRQLPDDTSRLSCVTHYYPATTQPFWFRFHSDRHALRSYKDLAGYVSYHYPLDRVDDGMASPFSG
jgi:phytanoyl-CoA hydroxylase